MYSTYDTFPTISDFIALYVIVNVILSSVAAYAASQKGRHGVGFFFLSLCLSFPAAMITALVLPSVIKPTQAGGVTSRIAKTAEGSLVRCPHCAEWVRIEARVCRHCGRDIDAAIAAILTEEQAAQDKRISDDATKSKGRTRVAEERARQRAAFRRTAQFKVIAAAVTLVIAGGITVGVTSFINRPPAPPLPTSSFAAAGLPAPSVSQWRSSLVQCGVQSNSVTYTDTNSITISSGDRGATQSSVNCFSSRNFGANITGLDAGTSRATPSGYYQSRSSQGTLFTFSLTPTNN